MGVFQAHVPEPRISGDDGPDSGEPAKQPAATVTSTSSPWDSPFAWAFPPERRKRHRWRLTRKRGERS